MVQMCEPISAEEDMEGADARYVKETGQELNIDLRYELGALTMVVILTLDSFPGQSCP